MAKRIKFPLEMQDGNKVRTSRSLNMFRENIEKIVTYIKLFYVVVIKILKKLNKFLIK